MQELDIVGSMGGGKGGKGQRQPIEANDTLKSKQTVKVLLAISEGEIASIEDIYLNRVSISNYNATFEVRKGTANQGTIPGFVDTEAPLAPFTSEDITQAEGRKVYPIPQEVDAVRLIFYVPELKHFLENGDLVGTSVSLAIDTQPDPLGSWTQVKTTVKSGKSSGKYAWDVLVERPANAGVTWGVGVRRITPDNISVKLSNKTFIASVVQIYYKNLTYPKTALVGITLADAEQFGGQVPEINIKGKFRKVRVPSNYTIDPNTGLGTYDGNWTTLQFNPVKQFTSNIAWIIYDILHDNACLNIPEQDIDKASFYQLSQYADQMVDDGKGGLIPRYHIGYQYFSRENVPSFLANLLSICNAQLSNNAVGQITIVFDHAGIQPTKLITNANVIDGIFNYSSNDLEGRTTQVNVTYNNFDQFGETDTVTWPMTIASGSLEEELQDRYGLQVSDIVLPGCRYPAQALRKARWAYYTNCLTTKFISFKTFLQGLTFYIGETVAIMDSENRQTSQHGVIKGSTLVGGTTTIQLDREITLAADSYTIQFTGTDGITLYEKNIFETDGTFTTVSFTGTETPFVGTVFILNNTNIEARLYKITGVSKEDNYYVIAGIEHDENKYNYIDEGITIDLPTGDFVNMTDFTVQPVTGLTVIPVSSNTGTISNIQLNVTWEWEYPTAKFIPKYIASWKRDNQDFSFINEIEGTSFSIDNAVPGTYEINVWAVNPATGLKSTVNNYVYNYRTTAGASSLLPPVNVSCDKNSTTLTYDTAALTLYFYYNILNDDIVEDSLLDYYVEIWDTAGITKFADYIVNPDVNKNGVFNFSFAENVSVFGQPTRQYQIKVYSRDLIGDVSTATSVVVNNPVPDAPTFTLIAGTGSAYVNITPPAGRDIAGYIVYQRPYSVSSWTPIPAEIVYDGPDTYVALGITEAGNYDFIVAAYDTFGKTGLNLAARQNVATLTAETDKFAFSGLEFTPNSPSVNSVSWASASVSINGAAPVAISSGNAAWTTGTLYLYFDKTTVSIGSTTDITVAVQKAQILAAYSGGTNLKGGDGSAFFNGSQILAQSIGANQLVTNDAIITNTAQLANAVVTNLAVEDGAITNAKIGNIIQSSNYSDSIKEGWKIDKNGVIETYGKIKIGTPNVGVGTPTSTFVQGSLTLNGNANLNRSIIKKDSATAAWDNQGYSVQSYANSCAARFSFAQNNALAAAGFSLNPSASADLNNLTYAIKTETNGKFVITNNGTTIVDDNTAPIFTAGTLSFTSSTNVTTTSNSITKASGTAAWNSQAYSNHSYTGNCGVRFRAGQTNTAKMLGLTTTPSLNASYTDIDYQIYLNSSGQVLVYEGSTSKGTYGTYTTSDVFEIRYLNGKIQYIKNNVEFASTTVNISQPLFLDSSLNTVGSSFTNIEFGSYLSFAAESSFVPDDFFELKYFSDKIEVYKNSNLIWTINSVPTNQTYFFDSSIYTQNAIIDQIQFGQYATITPDYGARMEISGDNIKVFDRNNILRVQLGRLN